ncbi:kinase-like protein [Apiospora arundinis]
MDTPHRNTTQLSSPFATDPQSNASSAQDELLVGRKRSDRLYTPIESIEAENVETYREGGFHPVKLGDRLLNEFEVVAKLGHGGFGTVWLCEEGYAYDGHTNWKAVKIIAADQSVEDNPELRIIEDLQSQGVTRAQWEAAGIMLPLRHFWIRGPNGTHLCLVFPVMGPNLRSQTRASADTIKEIFTQAGKSLQFLHRHGICHGDFRSDNILLHVNDVDKLSKKEMMTLLEAPRTEQVRLAGGTELNPGPDEECRAPPYLVECSNIGILGPKTQTATIDFGISYRSGDPRSSSASRRSGRRPRRNTGEACDVWSFIAMIHEIRCRGELWGSDTRREYVRDLETLLGPLPASYRRAWKREMVKEGIIKLDLDDHDGDDDGTTESLRPVSAAAEHIEKVRKEAREKSGYTDYLQGLIGAERDQVQYQRDINYVASPTSVPWRVPEDEVYQLADLFRKVLKYDPDDRIDIDEVMRHEWFKQGGEMASPTPARKTTVEKGSIKRSSTPPLNSGTATSPRNERDNTTPSSPPSNNASSRKGGEEENPKLDASLKKTSAPVDPVMVWIDSRSKKTSTPTLAPNSNPTPAPESNPTIHNHPPPLPHPSAGQQALDNCIHLMSYLILISTVAFIVILMLPIPLPSTTIIPSSSSSPSSSATHPLRFPSIIAIRQAWCASQGGCGSSDNITAAEAPIPWFQTRKVSRHSVFYEGILTVPSNETAAPDGAGRQVESGVGGENTLFDGLLVIPSIYK